MKVFHYQYGYDEHILTKEQKAEIQKEFSQPCEFIDIDHHISSAAWSSFLNFYLPKREPVAILVLRMGFVVVPNMYRIIRDLAQSIDILHIVVLGKKPFSNKNSIVEIL